MNLTWTGNVRQRNTQKQEVYPKTLTHRLALGGYGRLALSRIMLWLHLILLMVEILEPQKSIVLILQYALPYGYWIKKNL